MEMMGLRDIYRRIPEPLRPPAVTCAGMLVVFAVGLMFPTIEIFESPVHYLPVHTLLEAFSVIISLMVFVAAWRSGDQPRIDHLPLLGGAFFAVALIDTMHAFSYAGMPDFITPNTPDKAIDFWLASRFIAIGSLLAVAWMGPALASNIRLKTRVSAIAGVMVSALVFDIVIYHHQVLPHTFISGKGLTTAKITFEYMLSAMGLIAFAKFARLSAMRHQPYHAWLGMAALAFALSELFFTLYSSVSDLMNIIGHLFKVLGCLGIYLALFSKQGSQPWWSLAARLRLFVIILIGAFVIEYMIMLMLPYLFPEGSHPIIEAIVDASSMAVLGSITVILAIGRIQSRAMRAEYALDHTHDGYCVINAEGKFIDANASLCRMLGYTSKELSGLNIFALQPDDLHEENQINIPYIVETGYASFISRFRNKEGGMIDMEISANHLQDVHSFALFMQDITALKHSEKQIADLAYYDHLTRLPNRRLLMEHLEAALLNCAEKKRHCALLAINLDDFKQLNHAKGSEIGDEFLIATAKQIVSHVRDTDTVARIGGDEFIVILENIGTTEAKALNECRRMAHEIRNAVGSPAHLGEHGEITYQGSASIGITLTQQEAAADTLLRQALIAMHQAKRAHQDAIRFYNEDMQRLVSERVEMTEELRNAINTSALELYYQPQVDLYGRIIGAEALLRWQHPEKGLLTPASFVTLAEETGLIIPLGRMVLHQACRQLKSWQSKIGADDFILAVNISAIQFRDRNFVTMVKEEVEGAGIAPQSLKLELTESTLVDDTHQVIRQMRDLSGLGIRFSLDDFGIGYSSLSYLTNLPLTQLKIDQSFVHDIDTNPGHVAVVRTIINMGKALNLHVIAEGVETEAELDMLKQNGCLTFQGYLFSEPLPARVFTDLLRQKKINRVAQTA